MSEIKPRAPHPFASSGADDSGVLRLLESAADQLSHSVVQSIVANYASSHGISEASARTSLILLGLGTATRLEKNHARAMRDRQALQNALDGMGRAVGGGMRAANFAMGGLGSELSTLFMKQVVTGLR